jgi:hypothetical protein
MLKPMLTTAAAAALLLAGEADAQGGGKDIHGAAPLTAFLPDDTLEFFVTATPALQVELLCDREGPPDGISAAIFIHGPERRTRIEDGFGWGIPVGPDIWPGIPKRPGVVTWRLQLRAEVLPKVISIPEITVRTGREFYEVVEGNVMVGFHGEAPLCLFELWTRQRGIAGPGG